jgi:hypothetical protein
VGAECPLKIGDAVEEGDIIATVHVRPDEVQTDQLLIADLASAYEISTEPQEAHEVIIDVLGLNDWTDVSWAT